MSTAFLAVLAMLALIGATYALGARLPQLQRSYFFGVATWSRWLPVAATGLYLAVVAVNLAPNGPVRDHALSLAGVFSTVELVALFLVGPLYLTRIGNVLATATVAYGVERLLAATGSAPNVGLFFVTGAATVVAALGDKMPWLAAEGAQVLAHKLREITLVALTVGALGVLAVGLAKAPALSRWLTDLFGIPVTGPTVVAGIAATFAGWFAVAVDSSRRFLTPLLAVPTLLVLAYATAWPSALLIVPFCLCLSLSLTGDERRGKLRRRATGFTTSVVSFR